MNYEMIERTQIYLLEYMRLLKIEYLNEEDMSCQSNKLLDMKVKEVKSIIGVLETYKNNMF